MSIATELDRIKAAKTAIKSAINAKGGTLTDEQLDQYANAIASLPSGSSIDLTGVNVTADGLLEGVVAVNGAGQKVTGNIKTVLATLSANVVTVPKGYIAEAQTLTVSEMAEPSVSANVVTIPVGYNKAEKGVTIPEAEIVYGRSEGGNVTKHSLRISAGYVPEEKSWTFHETDLDGINATADKMLSGTVSLDAQGDKITGNIPTVTASLENDVVTVPKGYIAEQQTFEVGSSGGSMDFYKCAAVYGPRKVERIRVSEAGTATVNGDYEKTDLTTLSGGEVWKHLTADCYLYNLDGYWCINLNGYATWGESAYYYTYNADLTQWNVGYNWSDELPTGTDPAPSVSKIQVTLDADVPKTWDGYKAVLTDGVYSFEENLTAGMSYGEAFTPGKGRVYDATCTVAVSRLYKGLPDDLIFYAPLESDTSEAETGQALTYKGSPEVTEKDGIPCMYFNGSSNVYFPDAGFPSGKQPFTLCAMVNPSDVDGGWRCFFGWGSRGGSQTAMLLCNRNSNTLGISFYADESSTYPPPDGFGKWVHLAAVYDGQTINVYFNGTLAGSRSKDTDLWLSKGSIGCNTGDGEYFVGYLADCRIYNRALTDSEIKEISNKFFGSDSGADEPDNGGDTGGGESGNGYVVSGAGTAAINGNYYDTEVVVNGHPVYALRGTESANVTLMYYESYDNWTIVYGGCTLDQFKQSADPMTDYLMVATWAYKSSTSDITGTWYYNEWTASEPAPTVTNYSA